MLATVIRGLAGRYPTPAERQAILEYIESVPRRRAALEELRSAARAVAEDIVDRARQVYPQFERFHGRGYEKGVRDLEMSNAFLANATFANSTEMLDECWLHWYRTILRSAHLTPGFMRDVLRWWNESLKRRVSAAAFALLKPVLDHIELRLCDIPEPAKAEVGERVGKAAAVRG